MLRYTRAPVATASSVQKNSRKRKAEAQIGAIELALVGFGKQAEVLYNCIKNIPGVHVRAVCDIWEEYNQKRAVRILKKYKFDVNGYVDHREMLDKEKDLDAVIIATPDFWHAPHTIDCLEAGLHVYCEKEMSNTLEGARSMVEAARKYDRRVQLGTQRRSWPKIREAIEQSDAFLVFVSPVERAVRIRSRESGGAALHPGASDPRPEEEA